MRRSEFLASVVAGLTGGALLPHVLHAETRGVPAWPAGNPADDRFWSFLRDQFPLSHERAYLNTGGLGASPYAVIDAVKAKMDELEQVSETGHADELLQELKTGAAELFGCRAEELAFTRNTTEGINIVANGLPFAPGDEVILTTHEHVGNAATWVVLEKVKGIVLKRFEPSTASAEENLARIAGLLSPRTRLIAIPHIVTTTGLVMPVREISTFEPLSDDLKKVGLTEERIRTGIELRLRKAKIEVVYVENFPSDTPIFHVEVSGSKRNDKTFSFLIEVELWQKCILKRDPQIEAISATWSSGVFGLGSASTIANDLMGWVNSMMDTFVKAHASMNS